MSKVVDERVVSLQFDNRNFEKNIQGTLSTLDKFKQKLNLDGATKGLENINDAAKKVDMNPLAKGVETVVAKISSLDVMGVTALTRLTNAAIDAGKKIASSLFIQPKSDGFEEYEMTLKSIKTTMAGTGKTAEDVQKELKKLDEYADKTVYSTADMLNNLPKFTNAGIPLEKATTAMIGIANATALAGGGASQAASAFYNLSQSISTGYLTRVDYNSLSNVAGITTMKWKEEMIKAAIAQGTLTKVGEDAYKAGKKTFTLQSLFIDGLQEQWATTEVLMTVLGKYGDALDKDVGEKAWAAAQDITNFSQMMEALQATAGTGWKDTWQLIFGDLPAATKLWTGVFKAVSGIVESMADFRNSVLESALGRGFTNLAERISGVLKPVSKTSDKISEVVKTVKDYEEVVNQIIRGDWGNTEKRWNALTEAGYDWAHAQNLVNERLGCSKRYATEYSEAQNKVADAQKDTTKSNGKLIAGLVKMSDAELKAAGYTEDQIDALRELQKEADKTGYSIEEFVDNIENINGRSLLIDSFKNIGQSLASIFTAIKDAFVEIFNITPEGIGQGLYDLIAGFHKLTSKLTVSDETADKMKRTFKGLFAILDIVATIVGGPLKLAFNILSQLLGVFDLNLWDITAKIGDVIVGFRDWLDSVLDFTEIFEKMKPTIEKCVEAIENFIKLIKENFVNAFEKVRPTIEKFFTDVGDWLKDLKDDFSEIAPDLLEGLKNGIGKGAKNVWDAIVNFGKTLIQKVKDVFGINSPSTVMISIGSFLIAGLIAGIVGGKTDLFKSMDGVMNGLSDAAKTALDAMAEIFRAVAAFFPQFKLLNAFAYLIPVIKRLGSDTSSGFTEGLSEGAKQIFSTVSEIFKSVIEKVKNILGIHSPSRVFLGIGKFLIAGLVLGIVGSKTGLFSALGNVVSWIKDKIGELVDYLGSIQWPEIKMEYIIGAGALVGLVVFVKKLLDITKSFAKGVEAFGNGVETFSTVAKKLTSGLEPVKKGKFESIANNVLKLSIAIGILAGCVYLLAQLDYGKLWSAIGAIVVLAGVVVGIGALINAIDLQGKEFGKFSLMLISMSASLWIMASALKKLEFLKEDGSEAVLYGLAIMIIGLGTLLAAMGQFIQGETAANIDKAGKTILKISSALLLMTLVIKLLGKMDRNILIQGGVAIAAFGIMVGFLLKVTQFSGNKVDEAGGTILKIAAAIALMGLTAKLLGGMPREKWEQGMLSIACFSLMVGFLVKITNLAAGNDVQKVGGTILAVGGAMALMALTAVICSMMSPAGFWKGIGAIAAFGVIIAGLIWATKLATEKELKGVARTLLAASLAIAVMSLCAVILGMISLGGLIKGGIAVAAFGGIIIGMIAVTKNANDVHKNITSIAIAIGVMAAAIVVLSFIDPTKLFNATAAIMVLMGMFAIILSQAKNVQGSMGVLIVMTAAIAVMAGMIAWLASLPIESVIGSAIALGGLMLAMSAVLAICSVIGKHAGQAILGVLSLAALVVPMWLFVKIIQSMSGIENAVGITTVLINLMLGMSVVLGILTVIGLGGPAAIIGVGSLLALAVPLWVFIGLLGKMEELPNAVTNAEVLINLMRSMMEILVVLAIIGPLALIGVSAMYAFETLMVATGMMALAAAALMKIPGFAEFLDTGIEMLKRLAKGIGEIISSFAVGLTSGLPDVASNLTDFMNNLSGFISGANSIGDDLLDKVKTLSLAILALTAADLIAGISSFIQGGSSFAQLGSDLSAFMLNAMPFIMGLSMVKPESLTAVKALAEAILILTGAQLLEGLTSWLTGGSSLAEFGAELAAFGPHMAAYAAAVAGIDCAAVEASSKAAKSLAEMAAALPNEGGVVGWFAGENDMSTFGTQLVDFGKSIKDYSVAVSGIVLEPIMQSVEAGKALAEMADIVPNLGGVVSWFTGDNDLETFGTQIVSFGNSIKQYSLIVTGLVLEPIMQSVEAGKALAGLAEVIPNLGGVVSWFTGDNDLTTFGTQIVTFGASLLAYSATVAGLNIAAITLSVTAATLLSNLAKALPSDGGFWSLFKDDTIDFEEFGTQIKKLGAGMKGYSESVSGMNANAVSSSISSAKKLVTLIKSMAGLDSSGVATFSEAIGKLGKASVDKFVKAFTSSTSKLNNIGENLIKSVASGAKSANGNLTNVVNSAVNSMNNAFTSRQAAFKNIGVKLMTAFIAGINSKKSHISTIMKTVAASGVTGARGKYESFKSAGKYVVDGFVKGINDNKYKATRAGTALGNAAYKAAKEAIDSNSPSKKFMELGKFSDLGFAKGLSYYSFLATRASAELGGDVVTAMQDELGIHSPAKVIKDDVGKYVVQGLAEGITSDMSAEEAAEKKAKNIADAFKTEMAKHDSDMTTADLEYQLWEVHNEAATSAEKTAQKAASIYKRVASQTENVALAQAEYETAFKEFGENSEHTQEAYNKWIEEQIALNDETKKLLKLRTESIEQANEAANTSMEKSDLEYEKWELENPEASDAEKTARKLSSTLTKIKDQAAIVGRDRALWEDAKSRYGEESLEASKAYNTYLDSQIKLQTLRNDVDDGYKELFETQKIAKANYYELMREEGKKRLEWGIPQEEIEKWARKQTGYDPDVYEELTSHDIRELADAYAATAEQAFEEYMKNGIDPIAYAAGSQYGEGIAAGIESAAPGIKSAVETAGGAFSANASEQQTNWVKLGEQFVEKFAQGVTNTINTASEATITMITSAYQAAVDFINNAESNGYTITPRVSPILDLSNIQNGFGQVNGLLAANTMALADVNVRLTNDSITELSELTEKMRLSNEANHSEIVNTIKNLKGDFNSLVEAFEGMQVRLDSDAIVGELLGKIDNGLGQIVSHKGRGN